MKMLLGKATLLSLACSAVFAVAPGTVRADGAEDCRAMIGMNFERSAFSAGTPGSAWGALESYGASAFLSQKMTDECDVSVVVSGGKGKPTRDSGNLGKLVQDHCSMYRYLSSADSKLAQGKTMDAYMYADSMVAKLGRLYDSYKFQDYDVEKDDQPSILDSAMAVRSCIEGLLVD